MTAFHNKIALDGDPNRTIEFGFGLLVDVADSILSPERAAAEKAAAEKEARDAEEAIEAERLEAEEAAAFWQARHGEAPPARGVADVLREHDEVTDRLDRRQAREQFELESKILNGEIVVPAEDQRRVQAKLAQKEARARLVAKVEASNAKPASTGEINKIKNALGWLETRLDKTNRHMIAGMSDAQIEKILAAEEGRRH